MTGSPLDTDHPAFAGTPAGRVLPMPYVDYLIHDLGVEVDAAELVFWAQSGKRLSKWAARFRTARTTLMRYPDSPAAVAALGQIKAVATTFLGGMLRSERNLSGTCRRDWSDMVISLAWANALRSVDHTTKAGFPALGMRRDSVWHLTNSGIFIGPEIIGKSGNRVGVYHHPEKQLGRWKLGRHADVNEAILAAWSTGSPELVNQAIKDTHEAREGEQ